MICGTLIGHRLPFILTPPSYPIQSTLLCSSPLIFLYPSLPTREVVLTGRINENPMSKGLLLPKSNWRKKQWMYTCNLEGGDGLLPFSSFIPFPLNPQSGLSIGREAMVHFSPCTSLSVLALTFVVSIPFLSCVRHQY